MKGSLIDLVQRRAAERSAQRAYTFLKDGEAEVAWLNYGELERRARALGALLQDLGMKGERVVLLFPPGLDFIAGFFGCLFAGAVAVPAYPPRPRGRQYALSAIVGDARPSLVLTVSSIAVRAAVLAESEPVLAGLRWLALDELAAEDEERWAPRWVHPGVDGGGLAFLQYTSGSTAAPKGVMVSHGNLLHNEEMIRLAFGQSEESVIVSWLPLFHDMGLIGGVLQPLYLGASCVLMSPAAFLQRPARWLEAVSRYGATTSGGPDFAYRLCLERPAGPGLDLSRWSVAFVGAEPVRPETLERFAREMAPHGFRREAFYPCYGLAEATLFVTGNPPREPFRTMTLESTALGQGQALPAEGPGASVRLTACGRAWCGQEVAVVSPETGLRSPDGEVGEIWIAGPSVAGGYWERPEETAGTFAARLAREPESGPFLRTGDLGFWWQGDLYIAGRLKDLIILRGRNHYPQDLELTVERSHPGLRPGCGAAFAVEREGEERLVVVQEVAARRMSTEDAEAIADAVFEKVFEEHEVRLGELVLVEPGTVPKTSSGKVRRAACRGAYLDGTLAVVGRRAAGAPAITSGVEGAARSWEDGSVEGFLRQRLGEALGVPPGHLVADRPLVTLGLDSLAAIRLHHSLETVLGIAVSPVHLLAECTLNDLVAQAEAGGRRSADPQVLPVRAVDETLAPLSYGQKALWFLQRLAPGAAAYNVVAAAWVRQRLDTGSLRRAVAGLVDRHPALRTRFVERAGQPWQVVQPGGGEDCVCVYDFEGPEDLLRERLEQEAGRPFDLAGEPPLRVLVWRLPGRESVLLLAAHHIAVDFWSLSILASDLGTLYTAAVAGASVPAPPPQAAYIDFVHWQRRLLAGKRGERLRAYWEGALTPLPPPLELPADRPRGPVQSFAGATRTFVLDSAVTEQVHALAASRAVTVYTVLLTTFQVLLARLSGAASLLVGSPAAGRTDAAFAETVGYFVNPLVMRADLTGDPAFEALLGRTQETVLAALEHQDYPFLLLAEHLEEGRDPGRPPVFQVMFALQRARNPREQALAAFACGQEGVRVSLGGLELESMSCRERTAQTDLSLTLAMVQGRLCGQLRYSTELFDDSTVHRLSQYFSTLLAAALADPGRRVGELPVLTEGERRQVLRQGRRRAPVWPPQNLPSRVAAVARRFPGALAAAGPAGASLRYGELMERADRVAAGLRALGTGPEVLVGVVLERSPELLVAVLGILRAGGACLLLDPGREGLWLERVLERSGCRVVLTRGSLASRLPEHGATEVFLEHLEDCPGEGGAAWREIDPESLAFVVQTSGTSRQPHLAGLPHRSVAAWVEAWGESLAPENLSPLETVDGVFDLVLPLCLGGCVFLDPAAEEVSLASFSSALGGVWPGMEAADAYVLDRYGEPVPLGVAGELWLGGEGLARGYLASPEETARSFRPDPFGGRPGGRLVRIGDRARWRPGGRLEILGPRGREVEQEAVSPQDPDGAGPRTEIERTLVGIWRELLRVDELGIHDNFFQLGGNSLLAVQAVARMNEAFRLSLGVETLFRSPTVAGLALATDEHLIAQLGEEALEFL